MNQEEALRLAGEASGLADRGELEEAEALYRRALAEADPGQIRTPDIHGQYASVLARLHRPAEAERQYERALQLELKNDPDESAAAVLLARYVLGEHYLRTGEPESARRVVAPSLEASDQPLGWLVEAEALWLSGSENEARAAADRAVALCKDEGQRERMRSRLAAVWEERR